MGASSLYAGLKILSAGIFKYVTRRYSFSNLELPRPASILSMVRESIFRISASFSCESPISVLASRTAAARFCFASFIVIHLDSSLQYTSADVNYSRIQIESELKYMRNKYKEIHNIKYEEEQRIGTTHTLGHL